MFYLPNKAADAIGDAIHGSGKLKPIKAESEPAAVRKRRVGLEKGDVVRVRRKLQGLPPFWHYGVYLSRDEVVHFTSVDSDVSSGSAIMITSFREFQRDSKRVEALIFPKEYGVRPEGVSMDLSAECFRGYDLEDWKRTMRRAQYCLFPPAEVEERARRCVRNGYGPYNLLLNNCEHFAIWCATNIHESAQVEDLLTTIGSAILDELE